MIEIGMAVAITVVLRKLRKKDQQHYDSQQSPIEGGSSDILEIEF